MIKYACGILFAVTALPALAGASYGFQFAHKDWELACDNTRTCRAAGYQEDEPRMPPVSVMIERRAGPGQPVTGQVRIGAHAEDAPRPVSNVLAMSIDRKPQGDVRIDLETLTGKLSGAQVEALVRALAKESVLQWTDGHTAWTVSGTGAAAVLLKMDEWQRRIGTHGAVLRRGERGEDKVAPHVPLPRIVAAPAGSAEVKLPASARAALAREVRATLGKDDCEGLATEQPSTVRLTPEKLLVQVTCRTGPYNQGVGFWVANRAAPHSPVLVTLEGSSYAAGVIIAAQRGRGLGDCASTRQWVWDGRHFMLAEEATTGMCRAVAAGGAWKLPTYVANVKRR